LIYIKRLGSVFDPYEGAQAAHCASNPCVARLQQLTFAQAVAGSTYEARCRKAPILPKNRLSFSNSHISADKKKNAASLAAFFFLATA